MHIMNLSPPSLSLSLSLFDRQRLTLDGEAVVVSDDVTTSAYHVKDALDANFTYAPPSQEQEQVSSSEEDEDDDVDEPDIGIGNCAPDLIIIY